ncbi:MAG: MATE family efflux transporter, partial [Clostridiaceae bacterium]|nr:MATE family efflux transporter [Clostridiaceae bacterium]
IYKLDIDWSLMGKVVKIGLPNGIENGMFQFGLLILQRLTASFGTVALAANAIAKTLTPISHIASTSFGLILITIVGQCMGAKNIKHAKMYIWHVLRLNFTITAVVNIICIIFASRLVGIYHLSDEASRLAKEIFLIYTGMSIIFYPLAFVLPQALRGAGDTRFTMVVSFVTMFAVRVGLAYVLGKYMGFGIVGLWIAMTIEWVIKGGIYLIRYLRGKWQIIRII